MILTHELGVPVDNGKTKRQEPLGAIHFPRNCGHSNWSGVNGIFTGCLPFTWAN